MIWNFGKIRKIYCKPNIGYDRINLISCKIKNKEVSYMENVVMLDHFGYEMEIDYDYSPDYEVE
ncbi:hypothetical protein R3379_35455 [Bacillus sp. BAU-SS-2023]|nr:hypothetical protein [Bacillus sp. BAU-SS-2023]